MAFITRLILLICLCANLFYCKNVCPSKCFCDSFEGLNRAACIDQKLVYISVGVPSYVQIYNLSKNSIARLEQNCFQDNNYTAIEILDLSHNIISWMDLHAFSGLTELREVNLAYNRIESITRDLFWYNKKMSVLDLSGNKLTILYNGPLLRHLNLKSIDLSYSSISHLPNDTFIEMPNLREINLDGNYLATLGMQVLKPLTKLSLVNLKNNNWYCKTNTLRELQSWLINRKVIHQPICANKTAQLVKFEKIQEFVPDEPEQSEVDLDEIWDIPEQNVSDSDNKTVNSSATYKSFFELYNDRIPSWLSLLLGLLLGILVGIYATCFWLNKWCHCKKPREESTLRNTSIIWEDHYYLPNFNILRFNHACNESDDDLVLDGDETPPPAYDECSRFW